MKCLASQWWHITTTITKSIVKQVYCHCHQEVCKEEMAGLYFSAMTAKEAPKYTETDKSFHHRHCHGKHHRPNTRTRIKVLTFHLQTLHFSFICTISPPLPNTLRWILKFVLLIPHQWTRISPHLNYITSSQYHLLILHPHSQRHKITIRELWRLLASALLQLLGGGHGKLRSNGHQCYHHHHHIQHHHSQHRHRQHDHSQHHYHLHCQVIKCPNFQFPGFKFANVQVEFSAPPPDPSNPFLTVKSISLHNWPFLTILLW